MRSGYNWEAGKETEGKNGRVRGMSNIVALSRHDGVLISTEPL